MGRLIKRLFCNHKYYSQYTTHYTFVPNGPITTEHMYKCCKCGACKAVQVIDEEV